MIFNAWLFTDIAGCKYQLKFHKNHGHINIQRRLVANIDDSRAKWRLSFEDTSEMNLILFVSFEDTSEMKLIFICNSMDSWKDSYYQRLFDINVKVNIAMMLDLLFDGLSFYDWWI